MLIEQIILIEGNTVRVERRIDGANAASPIETEGVDLEDVELEGVQLGPNFASPLERVTTRSARTMGPGGNPAGLGPGGNPAPLGPGGNPMDLGPGGNPMDLGPGGSTAAGITVVFGPVTVHCCCSKSD